MDLVFASTTCFLYDEIHLSPFTYFFRLACSDIDENRPAGFTAGV